MNRIILLRMTLPHPTLLVMDDQEFSDWAGKEVSLNSDYLDCVIITSTYLYNAGSYTQLKNALNLQPGFSMEFAQENGFADTWHVAALAEDFPYSGNMVTSNTVESLTLQVGDQSQCIPSIPESAGRPGQKRCILLAGAVHSP